MAERTSPTVRDLAGPPESGYNYESLPPTILIRDIGLTLSGGPTPGDLAPDFELATTTDERVRLSGRRGRPVVLIFGSVT